MLPTLISHHNQHRSTCEGTKRKNNAYKQHKQTTWMKEGRNVIPRRPQWDTSSPPPSLALCPISHPKNLSIKIYSQKLEFIPPLSLRVRSNAVASLLHLIINASGSDGLPDPNPSRALADHAELAGTRPTRAQFRSGRSRSGGSPPGQPGAVPPRGC